MKLIMTSYLQWTTIGPALVGDLAFTLRTNPSRPVAWYGTPWSGQPVKWNWLISRISWAPRWREREIQIRHLRCCFTITWALLMHIWHALISSDLRSELHISQYLCVCVCTDLLQHHCFQSITLHMWIIHKYKTLKLNSVSLYSEKKIIIKRFQNEQQNITSTLQKSPGRLS